MIMKKVLFLLALLISPFISKAQSDAEDIFRISSDGSIDKKDALIEDFNDKDVLQKLEYHPASPFEFAVGSTTYTLKTCTFKDWDNEASGFNVINITKAGKVVFELKQSDLWTYTYGGPSSIDFKAYTDNKYFVPIKIKPTATALVFLGWPYGGDMPYMTIILATETHIELVFNQLMGLDSITKAPFFTMKVQTKLEEYDSSGKLCIAPEFATIRVSGHETLELIR